MTNNYTLVAFGEILKRVERFEARDDFKEYQFAGTYSFARGIFVSERKLGSTFKLPKIQRIHSGDFIYCKIMAWEGAFGVAPKETHNCVMSGAFVAYEVDQKRIDLNYLDYYFKVPSVWKSIGKQSTGTNVRRQSLHPSQFENAKIPLPTLLEQRRIVARIEELAAKVEAARELGRQLETDYEELCRSIIFDKSAGSPTRTPMRELLKLREPDIKVNEEDTYHFAGVYSFGRGMFRGQRKSGAEFAYTRLTRLQSGNFVYPKLMAWEGALGVVPPECDGLVVSTEFPVFEIDKTRILPETLDVYFRTPSVWPLLSDTSIGTNVRRRRLHPSNFLAFEMPVPPMAAQERLREIKARVNIIRPLKSDITAELDALMPAILDRAFRGEL